jgi:hypothetical protein
VKFLALDFWNGTQAQCELFRSNADISYPVLMLAGAAGVPQLYVSTYDVFIVVDGDGIIRYRRGSVWIESDVRANIDAALEDLPVGVADLPAREGCRLGEPYPNPFNPLTRIPLQIGRAGETAPVQLSVLDLRGRTVRELLLGPLPGGIEHEFIWDGRDDAGRQVGSGTYLVQLTVAGARQSRLVTLLK